MLPSEVIANPEHWTKNALARTPDGAPTAADTLSACKWCLVGACCKAAGEDQRLASKWVVILDRAIQFEPETQFTTVEEWNDKPHRTHAEVLTLLKSCNL